MDGKVIKKEINEEQGHGEEVGKVGGALGGRWD